MHLHLQELQYCIPILIKISYCLDLETLTRFASNLSYHTKLTTLSLEFTIEYLSQTTKNSLDTLYASLPYIR